MQPVGALLYGFGALMAELGKVGREDGWRNDGFRCHGGKQNLSSIWGRFKQTRVGEIGLEFGSCRRMGFGLYLSSFRWSDVSGVGFYLLLLG